MALSLKKIDSYILALLGNAEELIIEAQTLYDANLYPRAFTLAHFAREELSKCLILHSTGCQILSGAEVDWKTTMKRLSDHKSKLRLETVQNSLFVAAMGANEKSELMTFNVEAFANYRNKRKNASIYVGVDEGAITRPSESISKDQAFRTIRLAMASLAQEKKLWEIIGPFGSKKPGSEKSLKDLKSLTAEQLIETLLEIAPKYRQFLEIVESDEIKPNKKIKADEK